MTQRDLIVSLCKLESEDIALHAMSSKAWAALEKFQTWMKKIASSAHVVRRSFAILAHDVHITLNTSNQKMIIKRLIKNNVRLHKDLEMLRIAWLKKIVESEKTHSLLIIKIAIKTMMNRLLDVNMLNSYQECLCKLFEKNCCITQCYRCFDFDHIAKFCKNEECCFKCTDKHHIKECVVLMNRRWCANCNDSHELWRCSCLKWKLQIKQSEEIFWNRLIRYSEALKDNHSFSSFSLNFWVQWILWVQWTSWRRQAVETSTSQHDKWWESRRDELIALQAWLATQKTWRLNRHRNVKSENAKDSQRLKAYKKLSLRRINNSYRYLYDESNLSANSTVQHQKVIENSEIISDRQRNS